MKKIFMSLVAVALAVSASAQVYVGGAVGFGSSKYQGGDNETTYQITPEIGYKINSDWAIGITGGCGKTNADLVGLEPFGNSTISYSFVSPYVRYTIAQAGPVAFYGDFCLGYSHYNHVGDVYSVGVRPVIAFNMNKHFTVLSKIGFLGYNNYNYKQDGISNSDEFGFYLSGNKIELGLNYNF